MNIDNNKIEDIMQNNINKFSAIMIADSSHITTGCRLSTMHLCLPWHLTPELLRHRAFSFSSRSTRATPAKRMIQDCIDNPALPVEWGLNEPGMQANKLADIQTIHNALLEIQSLLVSTIETVEYLSNSLGLHKQIVNKYLMPYLWCDILVSSTTWANFLALRTHKDADPGMQIIAKLMADELINSAPNICNLGDFHTPYVDLIKCKEETGWDVYNSDNRPLYASAARCARVSIRNFDDNKEDWNKDITTARKLIDSRPMHSSPFEHVAWATDFEYRLNSAKSNFNSSWKQLRKEFNNETSNTFKWKDVEIK